MLFFIPVLPEFNVEVRTPDFILNNTNEIPVGIFARLERSSYCSVY